jgi:hypothetical protein
MVFECELAAVTVTATDAIPICDFLGLGEICFAADKSLFALMDCADVNSQIAFSGETAIAAVESAREHLSVFKTDITMSHLKVAPQLS